MSNSEHRISKLSPTSKLVIGRWKFKIAIDR